MNKNMIEATREEIKYPGTPFYTNNLFSFNPGKKYRYVIPDA